MRQFLQPDLVPVFDTRSAPRQPFSASRQTSFYGGGDAGEIGAAGIYAASNVFSWTQALLVPGIQAAANLLLMNKQKSDYDDITSEQRQLIGIAVQNYLASINSLLPQYQDALPTVPLAAEYVPVDACCLQRATIECNISTSGRADDYVRAVNRLHEQNDLIHAVALDPRFLVNIDLCSLSIQDLLRGKNPIGDVIEVLTDSAEQAALQGRIGATRRAVARDLGLSKARAQAVGRREFREHTGFTHQVVSPQSRQLDIREMMQTPAQRVALALTQAQLIQQSLQNLYNRNAQKDPYKLAQLQTQLDSIVTKLQFEANKATLVNTFVPNYAAILQPQIRAVAGAIGDAIGPANNTHYYGKPSQTQTGFTSPNINSQRSATDRPDQIYSGDSGK